MARIFIFSLGRLYFYFNRKEKDRIRNALSETFGLRREESDIRGITKEVFDGILSHYYEKLFIAFEEPKKATKFLNQSIASEDLNILHTRLLKGNGVILVTGHYGAIEYIPTLLAVNNFPISMIAKFKTEQLKKKVYSQAKKYNIRLIDAENRGNVARRAIKELKENRIVVTECDEIEEWRPSAKKKTSFLGKETILDRTISVIQKRTGAEIVFGVIHRYNLSEYKLIMYGYEDMLHTLHDMVPTSPGETVLKFLEQYIYSNPEQWYQWKTYADVRASPSLKAKVDIVKPPSLMKPAFGRIS
jgi:KDO2-lipid IV(A) lauroyltransferase